MLRFLPETRQPKTSRMPQSDNPPYIDTKPISSSSKRLEIVYPEVPTPAYFPGDIIQYSKSILSPTITNLWPTNTLIDNFKLTSLPLPEENLLERDLDQLSAHMGSHIPTTSRSVDTGSTHSHLVEKSTNKEQKYLIDEQQKPEVIPAKMNRNLSEKFSRAMILGIQKIFHSLLYNDALLYGLTCLILPYLAYTYLTASMLLLFLGTILIICCSLKAIKYFTSRFLTAHILQSDTIENLKNYRILDVILALGYVKDFSFYLTRLYLLAFADLTTTERNMILNDWDPSMDKLIGTHLIELVPPFLRSLLGSDNAVENQSDSDQQAASSIDKDLSSDDLSSDESSSAIDFVPESETIQQLNTIGVEQQNFDLSRHWGVPSRNVIKNDNKNSVSNDPIQQLGLSSSINLSPKPKSNSNFLPIIIHIIARRCLIHLPLNKFTHKLKLSMQYIFTIFAGFSLLVYFPQIKIIIKKLPLRFLLFALLSFYFYLLSHGWPKFLRRLFTQYKKRRTKHLHPQPPSSADNTPRSWTTEFSSTRHDEKTNDGLNDLIEELRTKHMFIPSFK